MQKYVLGLLLAGSFLAAKPAAAQVGIGIGVGPGMGYGGYGGGYRRGYPQRRSPRQVRPYFKPVVNFSVGYGYPNLDKNQFISFYNYYRGTAKDIGTITGALDVQYSRTSSIGVMVSHGYVTAPYYDYNSATSPVVFNGSLENWSVMLNLMQYFPTGNDRFMPYLRTAIGLNIWDEKYKDQSGAKMNVGADGPTQLAYQVGLGAKAYISKNTGLFVEAGYGKYIVHGGLTFRL
jgi:hypothetical protein